MKLLPISLHESFDSQNPWTSILSGSNSPGRKPLFRRALEIALLGVVALLACWIASMAQRPVLMQVTSSAAYIFLVSGAFLAPALGAGSRRALDTSSFLPDALQTPLPARAYIAALHGRILLCAALAWALCFVTIPFVTWTLYGRGIWHAAAMKSSAFHLFLEPLGFWKMTVLRSREVLAAGAVAGLAASMNYTMGVYLRASVLAAVCQISPRSTLFGGVITTGLIGASMMTCLIRSSVTYSVMFAGGRAGPAHPVAALLVLAAMECSLAAFRFVLAHATWSWMTRHALEETQKWLTSEPESTGG